MKRFGLEFGIIFKKRLIELRYGFGPYLSNGIASAIFTILTGVVSLLIYDSWNATQIYEFGKSDFEGGAKQFAISIDFSSVTDLVDIMEKETGLTARVFASKDEMEKGIYDSKEWFSFAVAITAFAPGTAVGTLYYNATEKARDGGFEMSKTKLSVLMTKTLFASSGSTLSLTYEPLNEGFEIVRLWGYFGPLMVSFALLNIGSALGIQLVDDRENYRLHSMITSGLREWVYWFANAVFDLCIFMMYVIIDWLILLGFGTEAITLNNWSGTFFLFVFCAIQTLPLVYLLSLFFDTLQSINSFLQSTLMVMTLIPYFIVTLALEGEITQTPALLLSIVPSYAVQYGLDIAAKRAVGVPLTAKDIWTGDMVKVFAVQIASAIGFGIVAVVVNILKNRSKGKTMKSTDDEETTMDDDVAAMEREIADGEHDDEAIVVKNLDKVYADSNGHTFKAVKNVSVYIKSGEMFGVLGSNGAGKSTLMSVITGRTNATKGKITIMGHPIRTGRDSKEYVSICPQFDNHLFPCLTPRQHFVLYGSLKGYSGADLEQQFDEYEEIMNLSKSSDKLVRELSGGNARKLAISLAFLGNAPIIFLDEPTASLDPVARLQTQELIREKSAGRTILLCTHLLSEAEKLCDRLCIMLAGRIHAVGTHQHMSDKFSTKWKVELGLTGDDEEARAVAHAFMLEHFPGCELAGTRFSAATYDVLSQDIQLPEVFVLLSENCDPKNGYTYFTCSMSTLERVFIDLVIQQES